MPKPEIVSGLVDVDRLARLLLAPDRAHPVVVVSVAGDTHRPRVSAAKIADRVASTVQVFVLGSTKDSEMLSERLPAGLNVYGGAVRTYAPRMRETDPKWEHPMVITRVGDDPARSERDVVADIEVTAQQEAADFSRGVLRALRDRLAKDAAADAGTRPAPPHPAPRLANVPNPAAVFGNRASGPTSPTSPSTAGEDPSLHTESPRLPDPPPVDSRPDPAPEPTPANSPSNQPTAGPEAEESVPTDLPAAGMLDAITAAVTGTVGPLVREVVAGVLTEMLGASTPTEQVDRLRAEIADLRDEKGELYELLTEAEDTSCRLRDELDAERSPVPVVADGTAFPTVYDDAIDQLRWEVSYAWLTGMSPAERAAAAVDVTDPDAWTILPGFCDGLDADLIPRTKVVQIMVEVLTGTVYARRPAKHLTTSDRGGKKVTRADGALMWRAYVKAQSPGAPRLHWWARPDGHIEFAQIGHHDDIPAG